MFQDTNQNPGKAQLWIVVLGTWLVAAVKKCLPIAWSLTTSAQVISVSISEKTPLVKLFSQSGDKHIEPAGSKKLHFVRLI